MKPDPDGSRLKLQDLRNLSGGEFFHVVEHKNNAQWRGDDEDRLVQQMMLFGVEQIRFRAVAGILEELPQLIVARHQLIEREHMRRSACSLASHAPAPVSGDGVEPDGQPLWVLDLSQVSKRTVKHFLHGVFSILRMSADLHAEGIDRILQQPDCLFRRLRRMQAQ